MKPFILFLCLFLNVNSLNAQIRPIKTKYAYGLKVSLISGNFTFKDNNLYGENPFESYNSKALGAFFQIRMNPHLCIQTELSMHNRAYYREDFYAVNIAPDYSPPKEVLFEVNGKLKVREVGVLAYITPFNFKIVAPYLLAGVSVGIHKNSNIQQFVHDGATVLEKDIKASLPERSILLGFGTSFKMSEKSKISVELRRFSTYHYMQTDGNATDVYLKGVMFTLGYLRDLKNKINKD
jgi:hypothetical protein